MEKRDGFFTHQVKSFGYAFEGLFYSFKKGTHFKMHVLAAIVVLVFGFIYSISLNEWLALILIAFSVLSAEAMNTAVEEACDVLHVEHHPGARLAKHCAAGAVLILSVGAIIIGLIIFAPKIF